MKSNKRKVDIVVISDVHLGTFGCHAKELLFYLKSIKPKTIILNGDFIDIWQFNKRYWPKSHTKLIKYLMGLIGKGVKVFYVTGNHDEMLRRFAGFKLGSFSVVNKLLLNLENNEQAWIFHGDVFDVTMQYSKWLARLGAIGYDFLILLNRFCNFISERILSRGKLSLSKKIKNGVKSALEYINDFEQTAADIGISNGYSYVICGHIHQPQDRLVVTAKGNIRYLNSGDWIENLTALEYNKGKWSIYHFVESMLDDDEKIDDEELDTSKLFDNLLQELTMKRTA
jgi:UDP-2,3-diacylglucosamine pyrophosphatase LpxH